MAAVAANRSAAREPSARLRWLLAPLLLIVGVGAGWALYPLLSSSSDLRVTGQLTGTVAVISDSGAKLCLNQAGAQRCSVLYQRSDSVGLRVGDNVTVVVAQLQTAAGETEVFVRVEPSR